ncbi:MAG: aldo/keto reductase [Steroidobacteraceae bacterium]|nr:aldo/keto reductase [Steroidobacteraceae bacterium]MDW8258440.1 aldo/keto reductase [Gammaproteobacteria bacterium]
MRYRLLGSSGLKVSELCLGTMTFGAVDTFGADAETSAGVYAAFRDAGGNFIDTANIYAGGRSEQILARLIAPERSRVVLASKYSMSTDPQELNAGGNSRKNLRESLDATLRRLATDYLDLYWVHIWDGLTPLEETLRALDDAVRAGKVLYVGWSNAPAWVVARAQTLAEWHGWSRGVALQLHYNLLERNVERELLPCAAALGMTVTAWSPLAGGLLTGKYRDAEGAQPAARLTTTGWGRGLLTPRNFAIVATLRQVAGRLGRTPAQVAIRWLLQRPGGVIPILGARDARQLHELLAAREFELDADALAELDAASRIDLAYPYSLLRGIGQKMVLGDRAPQLLVRN